MDALRVLVADDHELIRKGMRTIIEAQPGWVVVAEANNGRQAIEKVEEVKPDIALLDIGMPILNGLEAARQIAKKGLPTKLIIITVHESDALVREVLDAGARGYVLKSDAGNDLVTAVNAVRANKTYFTSKVAKIVSDGYLDRHNSSNGKDDGRPVSRLTKRQREIVQLLAEGKSSKEIAVALGLSVKTVETHRANIMSRLNCHSISELVCYAVRNDIIQP
jgi:DNA-binding NarL/FixJ family response regulator